MATAAPLWVFSLCVLYHLSCSINGWMSVGACICLCPHDGIREDFVPLFFRSLSPRHIWSPPISQVFARNINEKQNQLTWMCNLGHSEVKWRSGMTYVPNKCKWFAASTPSHLQTGRARQKTFQAYGSSKTNLHRVWGRFDEHAAVCSIWAGVYHWLFTLREHGWLLRIHRNSGWHWVIVP